MKNNALPTLYLPWMEKALTNYDSSLLSIYHRRLCESVRPPEFLARV